MLAPAASAAAAATVIPASSARQEDPDRTFNSIKASKLVIKKCHAVQKRRSRDFVALKM